MTRINSVPVEDLTDSHLLAEYRELPRIFTLVKKGKAKSNPVPNYTLGTGHVRFFYDKLEFLYKRYYFSIIPELEKRGYNVKPIPREDLIYVGDSNNWNDWHPDLNALKTCYRRLLDKLSTQHHTYYKNGVEALIERYRGILECDEKISNT